MNFCADDVNSGGFDEIAAVRKVYEQLSKLCEDARTEAREDAQAARPARARVRRLQNAVRSLMSKDVVDGIVRNATKEAGVHDHIGEATSMIKNFLHDVSLTDLLLGLLGTAAHVLEDVM